MTAAEIDLGGGSQKRTEGPILAPLGVLLALAGVATIGGWLPGRTLAPASEVGDRMMLGKAVAADQVWHGRMPLWNNRAGLGEPLLGDGQTAALYPTTLLHRLPPGWSWTIDAALRLWIGGVGAWALARRMGMTCPARFLAGAAVMLCGFGAAYLNTPLGNLMPTTPWVLLLVDRMVERVSVVAILLTSVLFTIGFLGGHAAGAAHLIMGAVVFWIARTAIPPAGVSHMRALAAGPGVIVAAAVAFMAAGVERSVYAELVAGGRIVGELPGVYEFPGGWVGIVPLVLGLLILVVGWRENRVILWGVVAIAALLRFRLLGRVMDDFVPTNPTTGALIVFSVAMAMLAGLGLDWVIQRMAAGPLTGLKFIPAGLSLKHATAGLIGLTALELLSIMVALNRGSSTSNRPIAAVPSGLERSSVDWTAIAPEVNEKMSALPRAWVARLGRYVADREAATAMMRQPRFDPVQMVPLVDLNVAPPPNDDEEVVRPRVVSRYASSATGSPAIEWFSDEGDKVKFRIGGGTGGYLVLADAWAPGWQATVQPLQAASRRNLEIDEPIQPRPVDAVVAAAFGFLRAVPLPYAGRAQGVEVIMDYKPEGWKKGLAASLLGGIVVLLLAGMSMMEGVIGGVPGKVQEEVVQSGH